MARDNRPLTFEGRVLFFTTKAVMFQGHFWHKGMILPKSQVDIVRHEDEEVVKLARWLANKIGVQEFTEYSEEEITKMRGEEDAQ